MLFLNFTHLLKGSSDLYMNFLVSIIADANRAMRVTPDPIRASRLLANSNNFQSSRRSSEDSLEDAGLGRDLRVSIFDEFYSIIDQINF